MTSASLIREAGHEMPLLWDNPEGWVGEGQWEGFQGGGTHVHRGWFMPMYGKNHHKNLQLKLIN